MAWTWQPDPTLSCWGTGELKRFDVSDRRHPRQTASVRLGGIERWHPHPLAGPLNGGPHPFDGERPHQVRLGGGDASSDTYCFPS